MRRSIASFIIAIATLGTLLVARQAPPPQTTFRAGVDVVQVDVSVLDRDRKPIRGLSASDFTVLEDGKPTSIVAFTPVTVPGPATKVGSAPSWPRDVSPDVVTNDIPRDGRLVVIMFDQTIKLVQQPIARRIATATVYQLGPADLAAVVHTVYGTSQGFTRDRGKLLAAINAAFMGLADGEDAMNETPGARPQDARSQSNASGPGARGICPYSLCTLETITRIADVVKDAPRRKTLLFIGTSLTLQAVGESSELKIAREKMFRALEVSNLTVHTMDPTGLETLAADASPPSGVRPSRDRTAVMSNNLLRQGNLSVIGDRTGGRTLMNANEPDSYLPAIFAESSYYYTLGFMPASLARDGKLHRISVRVNRPDALVTARKGHYAPGAPAVAGIEVPGASPALLDAVSTAWPTTDRPLSMAAAAFADPKKGRPIVTVAIATRRSGKPEGPVSVLATAIDREGRSSNYQHQVFDLTPALDATGTNDYEMLARLPVEPGRYELRVAVRDEAQGQTGSVFTTIVVPDFGKASLSLSGLVLAATPSPVTAAHEAFSDLLNVQPTARRTFSQTDEVSALLRLYQGGSTPLKAVTVVSQIQDSSGKAVLDETSTAPPERFTDRSIDLGMSVPVARLPPGEYLLRVSATLGSRTEQRDARFRVE